MTEYERYLNNSSEWQAQRRRAWLRADYACEQCGARAELNIHHVHYRTLGAERPDDLIVLCSTCHREEHAVRNRLLRVREQHGQDRLFDRWTDGETIAAPTRRAQERSRTTLRFLAVMRLAQTLKVRPIPERDRVAPMGDDVVDLGGERVAALEPTDPTEGLVS